MTKKQAKIILIVGWSIFAAVYLSLMVLCLIQRDYRNVILLILCAALIVIEWNRYVKKLKKQQ